MLADARKELAAGDSQAAHGPAGAAIEHYGNAWRHALLSHGRGGDGDRD